MDGGREGGGRYVRCTYARRCVEFKLQADHYRTHVIDVMRDMSPAFLLQAITHIYIYIYSPEETPNQRILTMSPMHTSTAQRGTC